MKKLLLIPMMFLMVSCASSTKVSIQNNFKLVGNTVYVNGEPYAKLKSINYGIRDKKEKYEAVFVLEQYVDPSTSREFIEFVADVRPSWDVYVEQHFIE